MALNRPGEFLVACRYVPYDQWFLTHLEKSWKIKHLKQTIVAKVLNLPFDRRHLGQGAVDPSPITFALHDGDHRPLSPIEFAGPNVRRRHRGGQHISEDDDNDDDDDDDDEYSILNDNGGSRGAHPDDVHLSGNASGHATVPSPPPATSPPSAAKLKPGGPGVVTTPGSQEEKDQIFTDVFTLIRFSTGQILEDNFLVSWYDLRPHELVELHASSPPATFPLTIVFRQLLVNGGSLNVDLPPELSHSVSNVDRMKLSHQVHTSLDLRSADPSASKHDTLGAKLSLTLCNPPQLTGLLRHDPVIYAQPYWEGWVRVLRVVIRSEIDVGIRKDRLGPGIPPWTQNPHLKGPEYTSRRSRDDRHGEKRTKVKKEWRERWAVIRDGFLNLCRDRNDTSPTHRFPLSALTNLTGAEYLANVTDRHRQSGPRDGGGKLNRPLSARLTARPDTKYGTKTAPAPHLPLHRSQDTENTRGPLSPVTLVSPAELDLRSQPATPSTLSSFQGNIETSTSPDPAQSHFPSEPVFSNRNSELSRHQRDRFDRERAALWELERESERKLKENSVRIKKEVESIMRWDDLGIFSKSKGKGKDKRRRMESTMPKERSDSERKVFDQPVSIPSRQPLIAPGGEKVKDKKDREPDRPQERHRGKDVTYQREHSVQDSGRNNRSYIPSSREEALSAGMWIVCARFRQMDKVEKTSTARGQVPEADKYSSIVPSLANYSHVHATDEAEEDEDKEENYKESQSRQVEQEHKEAELKQQTTTSTFQSVVSARKSSLPNLGHGSTPSNGLLGGIFGLKEKEKEREVLEKQRERSLKRVKGKERKMGEKVKGHGNEDSPDATTMGSSPPGDNSKFDSIPELSELRLRAHVEATSSSVKDSLTIDTSLASQSDPEEYLGLSSPSFAPNTDSDIDDPPLDRKPNIFWPTQSAEQQPPKSSGGKVDKGEWIVLDLGTDVAYSSFIRILHRHFPPPLQTSFIDTSAPVPEVNEDVTTPTNLSAAHQPHISASQLRSPLALPYPEWRNETIQRARAVGMLECGRPLELTLHGWGREFKNMSPEFRKQRSREERYRHQGRMCFLHGNKNRRATDHNLQAKAESDAPSSPSSRSQTSTLVSKTGDGSEQQNTEEELTSSRRDDNPISSLESMVFGDSEDESEDESVCWWKDIPRQSILQDMKNKQDKRPELDERQSTSAISFSDPFSLSDCGPSESSTATSTTLVGHSVTTPHQRPSSSSPGIASLNSLPSYNLKNLSTGHGGFVKSVTMGSRYPGPKFLQDERFPYFERRSELESYMDPTVFAVGRQDDSSGEGSIAGRPRDRRMPSSIRRMISPSRALSSPSSDDSLVSQGPSQRRQLQSRSFSPDKPFESRYQQAKPTSLLRRSSSITNMPHSSPFHVNTPPVPARPRDRTVTVPSSPNKLEILSAAQIHQIEIEIEAKMAAAASPPLTSSSPPYEGIDNKSNVPSTAQYSGMTEEWPPGNVLAPQLSSDVGPMQGPLANLDMDDRLRTKLSPSTSHNRFRKPSYATSPSSPSSPLNATQNHIHSTSNHESSIFAKAVLRRVRSGSSLQIPMGIHFEEMEENEL